MAGNWSLLLAVLSFVFGYTAYLLIWLPQAGSPWQVVQSSLDGVFFTFKLFAGVAPVEIRPQGPYGIPAAILLNIARFTAPATLLWAFFSRFSEIWRPGYILWRLRRLSRFDLIYGASPVADALRERNHRQDWWTVQVLPPRGADAKAPRVLDKATRTIVLNENDFLAVTARQSLQPRALLLLDQDDGVNVEASASDLFDGVETALRFVHIGDELLRLTHVAFSATDDGTGFQAFNASELAARVFFRTHDVFAQHLEAGLDRVHLCCLGFGEDALALMLQFVKIGWCPGLDRPLLTVFSHEADEAERLFAQRFAALNELVDLRFVDWTPNAPWFSAQEQVLADAPPSLFYVSDALGRHKRRVTLEVMDSCDRLGWEPLYLLMQPTAENVGWMRRQLAPGGLDISCLAPSPEFFSTEALSDVFDRIARRFHAAYAESMGAPAKSPEEEQTEWLTLPENFRASNRRAADGAKTKLEAMGIRGSVEAALSGKVARPDPDPALLEALSEAEHKSWFADRVVNGWRHGETRDNRRKRHPDLVPYEMLSEQVKELDRQQIQTLLAMMADPEDVPEDDRPPLPKSDNAMSGKPLP
ncbi:RyR domain-containing protein [Sagittula sp. S175]|uniref:RyR domain-containing protein n=1 Tax=Sagittula sp. S175 TaxID=3415129 RepID=UPI003C7E2B70